MNTTFRYYKIYDCIWVRLKYNQYYDYDEHFTVFKDTKEIKYKVKYLCIREENNLTVVFLVNPDRPKSRKIW